MSFGDAALVTPDIRWPKMPMTERVERFALSGATMGTRFSAVFYAQAGMDRTALQRELQQAVDTVDGQMSNWKPDSDLVRLNQAAVGQPVAVPVELFEVIALGLEIGRASSGAFDLGMGEIVDAWGFGPGKQPLRQAVVEGLAAGDARAAGERVRVDAATRSILKTASISFDLSGIAKGYGVDKLAEVLDRRGIGRYLVSIDGEVRSRGTKPGGVPWAVALERPLRQVREVARVLEVADVALATSGDYRHFAELDGKSVSHSMDPRTRRPVDNAVASVTVAASSCVVADAWATALLVAGEVEGPALARRMGIEAIFFVRDGQGFREIQVGAI